MRTKSALGETAVASTARPEIKAYSVPEAARVLGCTSQTIYNYLKNGRLERDRSVAGRVHVVTAESVERLLAAQEAQAR
jgi:excisionase family DNA binding protein